MWVAHLKENGFTVKTTDVPNIRQRSRKQAGVPGTVLASCHTAMVDGYVVEGHVPAEDIKRLLVRPSLDQGARGPRHARSDHQGWRGRTLSHTTSSRSTRTAS